MQGENHPLFGVGHTEESKRLMSESHKRIRPTEETREKLRARVPWWKGKHPEYLQGQNHPLWGKNHTEEAKRKMRENHADFSLEKHPQWNGGSSFEPYCPKFNDPLKESIRERDGRTCQLCGIQENGRRLDCHHVHYDKPNCDPDLVSLCRKCNLNVNFNRDYYETLFMKNLETRGLLKKK